GSLCSTSLMRASRVSRETGTSCRFLAIAIAAVIVFMSRPRPLNSSRRALLSCWRTLISFSIVKYRSRNSRTIWKSTATSDRSVDWAIAPLLRTLPPGRKTPVLGRGGVSCLWYTCDRGKRVSGLAGETALHSEENALCRSNRQPSFLHFNDDSIRAQLDTIGEP